VVTENYRVHRTVAALQTGDIAGIGRCLYDGHASLRNDFEVSCAELDLLVDILGGIAGVAGARLTGAGFGGCVISLVAQTAVNDVCEVLGRSYHPDTLPAGTGAEIWPIRISDGAGLLNI
jgi:galactokinase